ncbi:MAG: protein TolQ [Alphaproteobacteria bacterium]|jgi:biopolymer transport protein TolQ|nr:protein TolQ [Alphaproteobacteria bacterium]
MQASTFSILHLFTEADFIVRTISVLLLFASIYAWSIIIEKIFMMKRVKHATKLFEDAFWSGGDLDALYKKLEGKAFDPMSVVFTAAMKEWKRSSKILLKSITDSKVNNLYQRVDRIMGMTVEQESEKLEKKMTFLASVGSVAPFVGLFGTVWGIMESFSAIGSAKSTSIGVIAPGIATALSTTALGLIAAIPAVIGFNKLMDSISRYEMRLENFASEFFTIISRQIDEKVKK